MPPRQAVQPHQTYMIMELCFDNCALRRYARPAYPQFADARAECAPARRTPFDPARYQFFLARLIFTPPVAALMRWSAIALVLG